MKHGEIWLVNLDPTIGAEIRKQHPAIIVNVDQLGKLPLKVIIPLTDWKERYDVAPWMVKIPAVKAKQTNQNLCCRLFSGQIHFRFAFSQTIGSNPSRTIIRNRSCAESGIKNRPKIIRHNSHAARTLISLPATSNPPHSHSPLLLCN